MSAIQSDFLKLAKERQKVEEKTCTGDCTDTNYNPYIDHLNICPIQISKDKKRMADAGIDKRVIRVLFNGCKQTKALQFIDEYLETGYLKGGSLVLSGATGRGKTIAIGNLVKNLKRGKTIYAPDLPKIFLEDTDFHKIKNTKLLIIDDLGIEYRKEWFFSNFDSLLHYRYSNFMATVITTNLSGEEFKKIYSDRIISRLREWGKFIQLKGKDLRQR